jgi:hypothetical protein
MIDPLDKGHAPSAKSSSADGVIVIAMDIDNLSLAEISD